MMVETAVCDACGIGVRDESLFCYNCGEPVTGKPVNDAEARLDEEEEPSAMVTSAKPPLRSAASLRKQRLAFNREPVEISWERPAGPATAFIITTLVLAAGAVALMVIALYLR